MYRALLAVVILLTLAAVGLPSVPRPRSPTVVVETEPDPRKAKPLAQWPTEQDLTRLASAEGLSRPRGLQLLGHPCAVERHADGRELWRYPWQAACCVYFEKGVCTATFYTGGY
jgi:hypothetical protein